MGGGGGGGGSLAGFCFLPVVGGFQGEGMCVCGGVGVEAPLSPLQEVNHMELLLLWFMIYVDRPLTSDITGLMMTQPGRFLVCLWYEYKTEPFTL